MGMTKLAYMSISGKLKNIVDQLGGMTLGRPYSGGTYSISKNNRYAYTLGNVYSPSDLAVGYNTSFKRLTALNKDLFDHKELGNVEEVWFKSSFDERQIQGWLVKPPNFEIWNEAGINAQKVKAEKKSNKRVRNMSTIGMCLARLDDDSARRVTPGL